MYLSLTLINYLSIELMVGITHLAKFSEKLHFLPPDMHMYMCVSGGKKCLFFGKFYVNTIKIIPKYHFCAVQQQTTALQRARRKIWSITYNP